MNEDKDILIKVLLAMFTMFTVLKITSHIDWSWWWITAPLWIGVVFLLLILVILGIIAILVK